MNRLFRSRRDRMLAGVAAGLADYLAVDATVVRILWAVLGIASGGVLILLYLIMAIVVPEEPMTTPREPAAPDEPVPATPPAAPGDWRTGSMLDRRDSGSGRGALIGGIVLVIVGAIFLVREFFPAIDFDRLWPIALIAIGVALLVGSMRRGAS